MAIEKLLPKENCDSFYLPQIERGQEKRSVCNRATDAVISVCHWVPWKQWIWVALGWWAMVPNPAV